MQGDEPQFGADYYFNEDGFMVFTAAYLLRRGTCCRSGCRHCPYGFSAAAEPGQAGPEPPRESE